MTGQALTKDALLAVAEEWDGEAPSFSDILRASALHYESFNDIAQTFCARMCLLLEGIHECSPSTVCVWGKGENLPHPETQKLIVSLVGNIFENAASGFFVDGDDLWLRA